MASHSAMVALVLILHTVSAAPLRGQKSIQQKRTRIKQEIGAVGAEIKTAAKVSVVLSSVKAPKADSSFMSDEPAIGDDESPKIESKVAYTPPENVEEAGSSLPSFNFLVFCAAGIALAKLHLELQKQREVDDLKVVFKEGKDEEVKDWVSMAQASPYVQEASAMITNACSAADLFAKKKSTTDHKCDFGLPEDPQSNLDTRTIQDPDFYPNQPQDTWD